MDPQALAGLRFPRQNPSPPSPPGAPAPMPIDLGDGGLAWPAGLGGEIYRPGPQIGVCGLAPGGGLPQPKPRRARGGREAA